MVRKLDKRSTNPRHLRLDVPHPVDLPTDFGVLSLDLGNQLLGIDPRRHSESIAIAGKASLAG